VQATTVTPCATACRAIINDISRLGAPSSTPGSRWQCRSIKDPIPKTLFLEGT
jgi:hypothetical protein